MVDINLNIINFSKIPSSDVCKKLKNEEINFYKQIPFVLNKRQHYFNVILNEKRFDYDVYVNFKLKIEIGAIEI